MAIGSFAALVETGGRMEGGGPDGHQVEEGRKGVWNFSSKSRGRVGIGSSQKQQQHVPLRRTKLLQYRFTLWTDCERVFVHRRVAEILHLKFELAGSKLVSKS